MSQRIPDVPKKIDELSFSDFLRRVPIAEFDKDKVPPAVRVPGRIAKWHNRRKIGDPDIQAFKIKGEYTGTTYTFLSRLDWKGVFVPLVLVAPTDPAHDRFKEYHEYKKSDELVGEAEIREAARVLVNSYERSEASRINPDGEPFHKFVCINYSNRQIPFLTRPGWRGLWVHEIMRLDDDMEVEPQNRSYRKYKSVDEAIGESEVRNAARKYLADFDGVRSNRTRTGTVKAQIYSVRLGPRRQAVFKDIENFLSCAAKQGVSESDVLKWALDRAWIHLIPADFKSATIDEEALWGEGRKLAQNGTESDEESSNS